MEKAEQLAASHSEAAKATSRQLFAITNDRKQAQTELNAAMAELKASAAAMAELQARLDTQDRSVADSQEVPGWFSLLFSFRNHHPGQAK